MEYAILSDRNDANERFSQMTASYIVHFKAKGSLNCEAKTFGPFAWIIDAEDFLATLPVAANCDHKYIDVLMVPSVSNAAECHIWEA